VGPDSTVADTAAIRSSSFASSTRAKPLDRSVERVSPDHERRDLPSGCRERAEASRQRHVAMPQEDGLLGGRPQ
jgi:hypothetical protein